MEVSKDLIDKIVSCNTIDDNDTIIVKKYFETLIDFKFEKVAVLQQSGMVRLATFLDKNGEELPTKIAFHVGNNKYKLYSCELKKLMNQNTWLSW